MGKIILSENDFISIINKEHKINNDRFDTSIEKILMDYFPRRIKNGIMSYTHYDENDRIVYCGDRWNQNKYWKYNDQGKCVYHYSRMGGSPSKTKKYNYDEKGRLIYEEYKSSNGHVIKEEWKYNEYDKLVYHSKYNNSRYYYYKEDKLYLEYDENGNNTFSKQVLKDRSGNTTEYKIFSEYDDKGNMTKKKRINENEEEEYWEFNDKGNKIYYKNSDGYEAKWIYMPDGETLLSYQTSQGELINQNFR